MQLDRRQFLKLMGATTGVLAIPAVLTYGLVQDAQGESPPSVSPYAPLDTLEAWPSAPTAASPILLLVNDQGDNPFGLYLAEILRAEGLNSFQVGLLSNLKTAPLDWYGQVLLAEGPLNTSQAALLEGYVANGGRLVAMRPDPQLATLLGVEKLAGNTTESYLQVAVDHPIGQGITSRSLQFHGAADHYRLAGAQAVAWLSGPDEVPTDLPAVTLYRYGQGQASLWAFDLGRSVAYTRQGNPTWANQERDGGDGVRAPDMFKGWIDLDRIAIPQADEQQRLLGNLLTAMSEGTRPLPRLWYFPGAAEAMLVATGDSHGNPATAIEDVLRLVERRDGTFTVYYTSFPDSDLRRAVKKVVLGMKQSPSAQELLASQATSPAPYEVADWRARGHEFALHPYVEEGLEAGWNRYWQEFTGMGYGPVPPTTRTHRILWSGWVETARTQAAYGMRMNMDYYHWGPAFQDEEGKWLNGHFTGSGRPMKFVDEQGRILNIYQQPTQIADDHLLDLHWGGVARMPAEAALEVSQQLLKASAEADHSAIAANFHVDPFAVGGEWLPEARRWLEGTLDIATALDIPIWSAVDWLRFTEIRHDAGLENVQWEPGEGRLSFDLLAQDNSEVALTVMAPLHHDKADLVGLEVDGVTTGHGLRTVGGVEYGWVAVPAGFHQAVALYE